MHFTHELLGQYCAKTSVYPPNEMVTSSTKKKEEERYVRACEKVYSLSNPLLSELRQSYKDMMVCSLFMKNIKYPYLAGLMGVFGAYLEFTYKYMKTEFSKDPDTKKYFFETYDDWDHLAFTMFHNTLESLGNDQLVIEAYKEKYNSTSKSLKERFK